MPEYKNEFGFLNIFFKKTITRLEFFIFGILITQILFPMIWYILLIKISGNYGNLFGYISIIGIIALFVLYVTATIKRVADIGLSSNYILLAFVPPINFIFMIYLLFAKGRRLKY